MGESSDSAGSIESICSNSVGNEGGCTWDELFLRNSMTALVVDGVAACQHIAYDMLESVGVETKMVGSGQRALEFTRAHFDLILVDRHMHDMSGLQTIRLMRERGVRSKIVGLTSGEIETDRTEMINAGADYCLEKPLSADALADILAEIDCRH